MRSDGSEGVAVHMKHGLKRKKKDHHHFKLAHNNSLNSDF